jgi:DNA-binding HxlR family transcriptional regulator
MIIKKGFLDILEMADSNRLMSFNDFTKISRKNKKLSSATVAKRLDELIAARVMEEVVTKSKTGRRVIAYKTTEKGKKVIELAKELQVAVAASKSMAV